MFLDKSRGSQKLREKLVSEARTKFQKCMEDRWRQEQQWYLNLAFYFGQHYVRFLTETSSRRFSLYVPKAPYYRVRPVINQVRKVVRKEMSRLTSQQPNAYIIPASTEDRDIFAAQAGEQIWSHIWRKHKFNRTIRQAVFWQATCGNGFLKHWWNAKKMDDDNEVMGDIDIKAISPFHVLVSDLKEEILEEQPCIIHAVVKNRDWIKSYLGLEVSSGSLEAVDESLLRIMGIDTKAHNDTAIILEMWIKPGYMPELPEGGVFTVAANQIVQGWEGWPYSHKKYPFSKLDGIPTGKFYNDSIIQDLIPIQRELNRTRGQIIESKNKMSKPQLIAPEGSVLAHKITSEPGLVITYKQGFDPPQPLPLQNLPSYVSEEVNRLYTDIADLSGQHEVSQGQAPPGVTAATAISYLQEQDETLIAPHYDSLEEAIENCGQQCLVYVRDYWEDERTIRVVGIDSSFDVLTFKGSDIRGNTDIRVEAGSALPTSRAAKQAYITDLMKMGFIPPQEGLEVLEIGGLNKIYERIQVDTRQAQRENLKMAKVTEEHLVQQRNAWDQLPKEKRVDPTSGQLLNPPLLVPVHSYDNHQMHIEQHNRYRKSQSFELASDLTKLIFEEHVKQHSEALMVGVSGQIPSGMMSPLQEPPGGPAPPLDGPPQVEQMEQMEGMEEMA